MAEAAHLAMHCDPTLDTQFVYELLQVDQGIPVTPLYVLINEDHVHRA